MADKELEELERLYVDELTDAYDFEHQIFDALPRMSTLPVRASWRRLFASIARRHGTRFSV